MKRIITFLLLVSLITPSLLIANPTAYQNNIDVEMFIMRKGAKVLVTIMSEGSELPNLITIERKSTAPLSTYRTALTIDGKKLAILKEKGKLYLSDNFPESRQLDSYYRLTYSTNEGVLRTLPAIFLARSSSENAVTFGDHQKESSLFDNEEEMIFPTYEEYGIVFKVKREDIKVLVTISVNNPNLKGEFSIERKSAKPLATFRKVKTIYGDDKEAILQGERVFLDKYPESRQLDSYYRFVVTGNDGTKIEFPEVYLLGDNAKNN